MAEAPGSDALLNARAQLEKQRKEDIDDVLHALAEEAPALLTTFLDEMADLAPRKGDEITAAARPAECVLGNSDREGPWPSVYELVEKIAPRRAIHDEDAAALHLVLLPLPGRSDRDVEVWNGWKPVRFKAAVTGLGESALVLCANRARAGRSLFLPGARQERGPPRRPAPPRPVESSKLGLLPQAGERRSTSHLAAAPSGPPPTLFTRAWEGRKGLRRPGKPHTPAR